MITRLRKTLRGDDGASAVEYSLLVVAVAAIIVAVLFALGGKTLTNFQSTCDNWNAGAGTAGGC